MNLDNIIVKVKSLSLTEGKYIVFGSCPLAAAGKRTSHDIDLFVDSSLLKDLNRAGWRPINKGLNAKAYTHDVFEAYESWDVVSYNPKLATLLRTADYYDGVPFVSLKEVRKWKALSDRPKDIADVKLIDGFLKCKQA